MRLFFDNYLQTRYINLYNEKIRTDLKLLVIGDVHISDNVSLRKIDLLKDRILEEKADYVFFVGDLIDVVQEIHNSKSLLKLKSLLETSGKISKTFVILGNHDYIHRKNHSCHIENISDVICKINGVTLLDNDIYVDDNIWLMGYTETKEYYFGKNYNFRAFYDDLKKHDILYKNINKSLLTLALIHSPEFSDDKKCINLLKDYDLIMCGHTHDGCVPFGFGNFRRGVISPKKKFFPKNVRGIRRLNEGYILVTGGVVKISKCAPKLLHPLNHLCPMQIDVVMVSNKNKFGLNKKWY